MNVRRLLNTDMGQVLISILLGLGLATMFRQVCEGKNCLIFNGPVINEIDGKIYKFGEYCHKYNLNAVSCNPTKKIIKIGQIFQSAFQRSVRVACALGGAMSGRKRQYTEITAM